MYMFKVNNKNQNVVYFVEESKQEDENSQNVNKVLIKQNVSDRKIFAVET